MGASVVAARGADLTRGIPTKRLFSEAATRYSARPDLFDRRTSTVLTGGTSADFDRSAIDRSSASRECPLHAFSPSSARSPGIDRGAAAARPRASRASPDAPSPRARPSARAPRGAPPRVSPPASPRDRPRPPEGSRAAALGFPPAALLRARIHGARRRARGDDITRRPSPTTRLCRRSDDWFVARVRHAPTARDDDDNPTPPRARARPGRRRPSAHHGDGRPR